MFRFLGISQSLPVTSYVKMVDIWMLFTLTVPFLEVVLHTCTEVMARPGAPQFYPDGRVHQVKPAHQLLPPRYKPISVWMGVVGRLLLPILSFIFTAIFWVVGLCVSYWPNIQLDPNMTECLTNELD